MTCGPSRCRCVLFPKLARFLSLRCRPAAKPPPRSSSVAGSGTAGPTVAVKVDDVEAVLKNKTPPVVRTGLLFHWMRFAVPAMGPIDEAMSHAAIAGPLNKSPPPEENPTKPTTMFSK